MFQGVANHDVFFGAEDDQAAYLTDMNLQMYENLTTVASKQGAQVLVFPEFGLEPIRNANRTDLYAYAETVPAVSGTGVNPCNEADDFANRPILLRMSCVAQKQSILVLINMIDYQPCAPSADPNCPEDERYLVKNIAVVRNLEILTYIQLFLLFIFMVVQHGCYV